MVNCYNSSFLFTYYLKKIILNLFINLIFTFKIPLVVVIIVYGVLTAQEIGCILKLPFYNLKTNKAYFRLILHELIIMLEILVLY
jgi:hypothetical protein